MELKQLSEIVFNFYNVGRPSSTSKTFSKKDIEQFCKMGYGSTLRQRYYEDKKMDDGGTLDMIAGSLDIKEYPLGDVNVIGMRRAKITDEVVRMPRNSDVVNVYPMGEGDCMEDIGESLSQVQPGEENFYLTPEMAFFMFFVQKGKNVDTYHLPPCVTKVQVERIYISDDLDIPLDMAYEIALSVLGVTLKIKEFLPTQDNSFDGNKNQLRYQLEKQEAVK